MSPYISKTNEEYEGIHLNFNDMQESIIMSILSFSYGESNIYCGDLLKTS